MDTPQTIDWDEQEFTEVRPGIFGSTVHTPQLTATLYRYGAGIELGGAPASPGSDHPGARGDDRLRRRRRSPSVSSPGSSATLPGGTPHSATVPAEGPAVTLNVFTYREATPSA